MNLVNRMLILLGILLCFGGQVINSDSNSGNSSKIDQQKSLIFAPEGETSKNPLIVGMIKRKNGKPVKNRKVTVFIDDKALALVTTDENGVFAYQVRANRPLLDGKHSVYAVEKKYGTYVRGLSFTVDASRNVNFIQTRSGNVSVSNSSILFPGPEYSIGATTFSIVCSLRDSGNNPVFGETMTLKTDSTTVSTSTQSNSSGIATYTLTGGQALSEGEHTCDAHAQESNVDLTQRHFYVDVTAPAAPVITAPTDQSTVFSSTVLVTGTAEPFNQIFVFFDSAETGEITEADGSGDWEMEYLDVENGGHSVHARQQDAALNESNNSSTISFSVSA